MTNSQDYGSYPAVGEIPAQSGYPLGGSVAAPPRPDSYSSPSHAEEQPTAADVAKDQASNVAGGAADAAQHVAGVTKEQVGQVTAEAGQQVKQLLGQAQSELSTQAQAQQSKLAGGLHAVGDQLKTMATNSDQPGAATDLAHQAASKAHQVADWLEGRDPAAVLDEARSFARQRPGMFLAVALGAGLLAGRLARGLAADPDESASNGQPATRNATSVTGRPAVAIDSSPLPGTPSPIEDGDLYGTGLVQDWTGRTAGSGGER